MINGATKLPKATGGTPPEDQDALDATDGEQVNTGTNLFPAEEKEPPVPGQVRKEWVTCKLTTDQRSELATEMAEILANMDARAEEFKETAKDYREGRKILEEQLRQARRGVEKGEMDRLIDVKDEVHDLSMATVRCDTGATIRTRPLTDAERQEQLFDKTVEPGSEEQEKRRKRGSKKGAETEGAP